MIDSLDLDEDMRAEGDRLRSRVDPLVVTNSLFDGFAAFNSRPVLWDRVVS